MRAKAAVRWVQAASVRMPGSDEVSVAVEDDPFVVPEGERAEQRIPCLSE